jgi:hypothetical protein
MLSHGTKVLDEQCGMSLFRRPEVSLDSEVEPQGAALEPRPAALRELAGLGFP